MTIIAGRPPDLKTISNKISYTLLHWYCLCNKQENRAINFISTSSKKLGVQ